jgi:hypothetical protein
MSSSNPVGRPPVVFSEQQIAQVEALASVLTKGQLADYFNICENTFREAEARQPAISEAYKRGRSKAIAGVGSNLISQARKGNVTAAIFYLKTQAGWKEQSDILDADPGQIVTIIRATRPD